MQGHLQTQKERIKEEAFKILILDKEIIMEDYIIIINITPDEFELFNSCLIDLYEQKGLLNLYLEELDEHLDDFYYIALFDHNLAKIDFNYFFKQMILILKSYGPIEIVGADFSKIDEELSKERDPKIINLKTYKQYQKIINNNYNQ